MARQPAQNLAFVPALIGQVENPPALQSIACFHFVHERSPLRIGEPGHLASGKRDHAGCVIDASRAAQAAFLLSLERALLRNSFGSAHARGNARHRQPYRQKIHQGTGHRFVRSQTGIFLKPAHQPRPARQRQQFGLNYVLPVVFLEILTVEVIQNRIWCRK